MMKTTTFSSVTNVFAWLFLALLLMAAPAVLKAQAPAWQWATSTNVSTGPSAFAPNGDVYTSGALGTYANFGSLPVVSNTVYGSSGTTSFVGRMNGATKQWAWVTPFIGRVFQLTTASDGGLTVVGDFHSTITFGSISLQSSSPHCLFVAHCNSNGQWQWATAAPLNFSGVSTSYYALSATNVAPNGDVVVAGVFVGIATFGTLAPLVGTGPQAYFVARLNGQTGQWLWASQAPIATTAPNNNTVNSIAQAPNGNVVFTGSLNGTASFGTQLAQATSTNLLIASLNGTTGQWQWAARASHAGAGKGTAVAISSTGDVVVAGQVTGPVAFGTLPQLPGTGGAMVVAGLSGSTGQWQWARQTGGTHLQVNAMALTSSDDVVVTGLVTDTLRIGNLPRETFLGAGCFVAKLTAQGGVWQWQAVAKPIMRSVGLSWNFVYAFYLSLSAADEPLISGPISSLNYFGSSILLPSESIPPVGLDYPFGSFVAKLAAMPLATTSAALSAQTQLYPNPATGSFTLRLPSTSTLATSATLLNSVGQVVRRQSVPAHSQNVSIDVHALAPGLYIVLLPLGSETISRRVTIE